MSTMITLSGSRYTSAGWQEFRWRLPKIKFSYVGVSERSVNVTLGGNAYGYAGVTEWSDTSPDSSVDVILPWRGLDIVTLTHESVHVGQAGVSWVRKHGTIRKLFPPRAQRAAYAGWGEEGLYNELQAYEAERCVYKCYDAMLEHSIPLEVLSPRDGVRFDKRGGKK